MLTLNDLPSNQQRLVSELSESAAFLKIAQELRKQVIIQPIRKIDKNTLPSNSIAMKFARDSGYMEGVMHVLNLLEGKTADGGRDDRDGPAREPDGR